MDENVSKVRKVVLREDLMAITEDYREAIILGQFLYWSDRVKDADKLIEQENEIARRNGEVEREPLYGWIYKTAEQMADEVLMKISARQVAKYITNLVEKGFLDRRNNPKYKWDRTYQYKVNFVNVAIALRNNGYSLSDYKIDLPDDLTKPVVVHLNSTTNGSDAEGEAIPYITTEITNNYTNIPINNNSKRVFFAENDAFDLRIVSRQVKKACDDYGANPNEIVAVINYYYKRYTERTGRDHPRLKQKQMDEVVSRFIFGTDKTDDLTVESWVTLIDKHFDTDYGVKQDWNINYFISEDVINNRYYETLFYA